MLILNAQDISRALSYTQLIDSIEKAFLIQEKQDFIMPKRMHIEQNENVLLLMPAFIEDYFATKLISIFPENKNLNQAVIQGKLILNDAKTGKALALMDAPKLTALRTAAIGAVAIKHLHKKSVNSLGLFGAGIQGFHQIILAHHIHKFKQVFIYDPFTDQVKQAKFKSSLIEELPNISCFFVSKPEEVLQQTDLIITATTSDHPVLPNNKEVLKGKTFIAIGSFKPKMRELPESLFSNIDQLFIDTPAALEESGDLVYPLKKKWIQKNQIHVMGELIHGNINRSKLETAVFKSVGMALFDLMVAKQIYEQAIKQNLGTKIQD